MKCGISEQKIRRDAYAFLDHLESLTAVSYTHLDVYKRQSKVFEFYTEDYADTMSLAVFLISLAVSVYFAAVSYTHLDVYKRQVVETENNRRS